MLTAIMLIWVGLELSAPTWYFVVGIMLLLFKVAEFGVKMYDMGAKH